MTEEADALRKRRPGRIGTMAVWALVILSAAALRAKAQGSANGSVRGMIRDPDGRTVQGAEVVIRNPFGTRQTRTDGSGQFRRTSSATCSPRCPALSCTH